MTKLIQSTSTNFHLTFPVDNKIITDIKGIEGRKWIPDKRCWIINANPLTAYKVQQLSDKFRFEIDHEARKLMDTLMGNRLLFERLSSALSDDFNVEGLQKELRAYQKAVVHIGVVSKRVLLAMEMRTGKTPTSIAIVHHLNAYPCLVVCPDVMKYKWKSEIHKWLGDDVDAVVTNAKSYCVSPMYSIINYDLITKYQKKILETKWGSIIGDESHRLANPKSLRSRVFKEISKDIPVRLLLSGTPDPNSTKNLAHQLDILGHIDSLGGLWRFYIDHCAAHKTHFGWDINGSSNLPQLYDKLKSLGAMVIRKKKDVLPQLPPKTIEIIEVDIDNMADYQAVIREGKKVMDNNSAFTILAKLRMIVGLGKLHAIKQSVADFILSGNKLVIFAHHRSVMAQIASWYPRVTLMINGDDNGEQKNKKAEQFQSDDKIKIIICSDEIGEGVDFSKASYSMHCELLWTWDKFKQNSDRLHSHDSVNPVFCSIFKSRTGMDKMMLQVMERKKESSLTNLEILKHIIYERN